MSCPFQTRVSGWYFKVMLSAAVFLDMITLQYVCFVRGCVLWILHIYWSLLMTLFFPEVEMTTNELTLQGLEYLKVPRSTARLWRGADRAHDGSHQRGITHPILSRNWPFAFWLVGCWEPERAISTLSAEDSGAKLHNSLLFKENFPALLPGARGGKLAPSAWAVPWRTMAQSPVADCCPRVLVQHAVGTRLSEEGGGGRPGAPGLPLPLNNKAGPSLQSSCHLWASRAFGFPASTTCRHNMAPCVVGQEQAPGAQNTNGKATMIPCWHTWWKRHLLLHSDSRHLPL